MHNPDVQMKIYHWTCDRKDILDLYVAARLSKWIYYEPSKFDGVWDGCMDMAVYNVPSEFWPDSEGNDDESMSSGSGCEWEYYSD